MGGNNLKIDINKDFLKEYKDNFFKGFSVSEVIHLVTALGVAALIMLSGIFILILWPQCIYQCRLLYRLFFQGYISIRII